MHRGPLETPLHPPRPLCQPLGGYISGPARARPPGQPCCPMSSQDEKQKERIYGMLEHARQLHRRRIISQGTANWNPCIQEQTKNIRKKMLEVEDSSFHDSVQRVLSGFDQDNLSVDMPCHSQGAVTRQSPKNRRAFRSLSPPCASDRVARPHHTPLPAPVSSCPRASSAGTRSDPGLFMERAPLQRSRSALDSRGARPDYSGPRDRFAWPHCAPVPSCRRVSPARWSDEGPLQRPTSALDRGGGRAEHSGRGCRTWLDEWPARRASSNTRRPTGPARPCLDIMNGPQPCHRDRRSTTRNRGLFCDCTAEKTEAEIREQSYACMRHMLRNSRTS